MGFNEYVNGLAALSIASVAAALSATLLKSQLLPEQLSWLGAAGTVVAAVMIAVSFTLRDALDGQWIKVILTIILMATCVCVIYLRGTLVAQVEIKGSPHAYLIGRTLTSAGQTARNNCQADSNEELIECSGAETIPSLFGASYRHAAILYIGAYLLMLAAFVQLVSALKLEKP
jgi:hypothetical protein